LVVFPVPSCPLEFWPQQKIFPALIAQVWFAPALIDFQLVSAPMRTGVSWRVVFPVPSCPVALDPQQ
jgi:hypothetical protein